MGREGKHIRQQGGVRGGEVEEFALGFMFLPDLQQGDGAPTDPGIGDVAEIAEMKIRLFPSEIGRDAQRAP